MMKRWKLFVAGLAVYAGGLLATLPAAFVDVGLRYASGGKVRLTEAQGTAWSGAGRIEVRNVGGSTEFARQMTWRFLPGALLRAQLVCEIGLGQAGQRIPVKISPSRVELTEAEISLPVAVLGLGVPKLAALRLTGDVLLHVVSLSVGSAGVTGDATLRWHAAGSALVPLSPLGEYELRFQERGELVKVVLSTRQGLLQLDGQGTWTNGGTPAFFATARVPARHQQQLAPLLRLIAVERGEGNFELQLK